VLLLCGIVISILPGCGVDDALLSDVEGWDLSACSGNLDVCLEFFEDNQDRITGGEGLLEFLLGLSLGI
jgi:hypothetical protein